jgi:energy-coupling factor transporter ATP-binding protein EcfA2
MKTFRAHPFSLPSFCPQFGGLWQALSAYEHLALYTGLRGFAADAVPMVVDEVLAVLGIDAATAAPEAESSVAAVPSVSFRNKRLNKRVRELSGGNQRKLSAALALVGGPRIVYLDEPSTGVDAATRRHLWQIIRSNRRGRAVVLTTHSMDEADDLSDRIAIMARGRLKGEWVGGWVDGWVGGWVQKKILKCCSCILPLISSLFFILYLRPVRHHSYRNAPGAEISAWSRVPAGHQAGRCGGCRGVRHRRAVRGKSPARREA